MTGFMAGWYITTDNKGAIIFRPDGEGYINDCFFDDVRLVSNADKNELRIYPDPDHTGPGITYE